jgi:hypothetical protein
VHSATPRSGIEYAAQHAISAFDDVLVAAAAIRHVEDYRGN